ncbi:DNA cytosine methyltransferase [Ornithinimicrobium sp. Arc0846-15]|nr:DNA cytosine methyltransferase [Ornithinimicrobium laminariae]
MSTTPGVNYRAARDAPIRTLDLFAGAGGLSQGWIDADIPHDVVRAVEFDAAAAATFRENYGDVVYAGPIERWLDEESVPHADVVIGGPPCQGFSQLGRQDKLDIRNGLWEQYALTIAAARPKYFVMENVTRFLDSPQMQLMEAATQVGGILTDYEIESAILNAADFGAAQLRKRAVVIGHHKDLLAPGMPAPNTKRSQHRTLKDVLSGLPEFVDDAELPPRSIDVDGRTMSGPYRTDELHLTRNYERLSLDRFAAIPAGGNRFDLPYELQAPCWRRHQTGSGDVMGRLSWDKPSVTIRTEFFKPEKGRYLHPTENRALTHHEAARIQGFPDGHRWVGSKTAIAKQIGNAVPIPLASALATHVASALSRS